MTKEFETWLVHQIIGKTDKLPAEDFAHFLSGLRLNNEITLNAIRLNISAWASEYSTQNSENANLVDGDADIVYSAVRSKFFD